MRNIVCELRWRRYATLHGDCISLLMRLFVAHGDCTQQLWELYVGASAQNVCCARELLAWGCRLLRALWCTCYSVFALLGGRRNVQLVVTCYKETLYAAGALNQELEQKTSKGIHTRVIGQPTNVGQHHHACQKLRSAPTRATNGNPSTSLP